MSGTAIQETRNEEALGRPADDDGGALLRYAVEKNVPVEVLERLVALQERVSDRQAQAAMVEALGRFQAGCPSIHKSKTARIATKSGGSYSYSYAPLDAIARAIRPILHAHGLSYTWDSTVDNGNVSCTCTLRHVEGHQIQATFTAPSETKAEMSGAQKHAAALTYARRQSLVQVLGLATADDDLDGATPPPQPITPSQAADIDALLDESGADRQAFLDWLGVESVEAIPSSRHAEVVNALERKRAARRNAR